jgi:thioesterase domain-containing protein
LRVQATLGRLARLPEPQPMLEITDTHSLERLIRSSIPLARAMDLRLLDYDGNRLALAAPLAPNVNDKGCAFGGSMTGMLTLAGWGLINLKLAQAGIDADVFVQDASIVYLTPVWQEIVAEAYAPDNAWPGFIESMRSKGKARISIDAEISDGEGGGIAARQSARFVAKLAATRSTQATEPPT